jgi:GTPase
MDWTEIVKKSSKIISFFDLAGHEKYLKTTILGLSSSFPDICVITVGANMGITRMTKEHIFLCVILGIPFCVVVTKIDICKDRKHIMKQTLDDIKKILKMPGIRRIAYKVNNNEDSILCSKNIYTQSIVPLFFVSNVTGIGIENLKYFFNLINKHKVNTNNEKENVEYHIDTIFSVSGVGTITGGHLKYGTIKMGDKLMLGPNNNTYETFQVKSIHCKKTLVNSVSASCYVCLNLRKANKKNIRRGNVLLSINSKPVFVTKFKADITILKTHSTTIKVGYEPIIHVSAIRQSARIIEIMNKISNKKNDEDDQILRTGDKALVKFELRYRPEFLTVGNKILLAEGKVKIIGTIKEII